MAVTLNGHYLVADAGNNYFDASGYLNIGFVALEGNDRVYSNNGSNANSFDGGHGADNLFFATGTAGSSAGTLDGGEGNDLLSGSGGEDMIYGGAGDDRIDGNWEGNSSDDDVLYGGSGQDAVFGGGGNDELYGGADNDKGTISTASPTTYIDNQINFKANAGLYGGDGNDYVDGGAGDDLLSGGNGADIMNGGGGSDTFYFDGKLGSGVDRIRDFSRGEGDEIVLAKTIFSAVGDGLSKKEFQIGKQATDKNDYVIYNQKKGTIAYDHDGKGGDKAVVFATVEKGLKLAAADFDVDLIS